MCVFISGTNVWWVSSSGGQAARSMRWPLGAAVLLMDGTACTHIKCSPTNPSASNILVLFATNGCNCGTPTHRETKSYLTNIHPSISSHSSLRSLSIPEVKRQTLVIKYIFELRCKNHIPCPPGIEGNYSHSWVPVSASSTQVVNQPAQRQLFFFLSLEESGGTCKSKLYKAEKAEVSCHKGNHIWALFAGGCQCVQHGPATFGGCYWQIAGRIPPDNNVLFRCVIVCIK